MLPTRYLSALAVLPLLLLTRSASGEDIPRTFRFPDIHRDVVVFAYAGDIWRAPTAGGPARRLTSHPGLELFPRLSRDGRQVAFSGEHSGSRQVYVMPLDGGTPRQLTFYTDWGEMPPRGGWDYWIQDWTPDGKILVSCNRTPWGERMARYCLVDPDGGLETYLPLPEGGSASLSPDGTRLAYTPVGREFRTWKRTRGGRAQDLWLYDLVNHRSERLTTFPGTDNQPMWAGDTVYFTSDREHTLNLFALELDSRELRQVTHFNDWDVLWPALGPEAIVFQNGGHLHRFDLATGQTTRLEITIDAALPHTVPHFRDVRDNIRGADLSPSGQRVVFDARGELFSVPREQGPTRNLTRTPGIRETDPTWSPDGRWIAHFSDASGEYELYLRSALDPAAPPHRLTSGGDVWLQTPVWSPDSTKIAWSDADRRLRYVELAGAGLESPGGEVRASEVHDVTRGVQANVTGYRFSPDGRWLVSETHHPSRLPGLAVHDLDRGTSTLLGDGLSADSGAVWSHDGRHLFFLSNRDFQPRFSSFELDLVYDRATRIYAAALDPEAPPLFPHESDEEELASAAGEPGDGTGDEADGDATSDATSDADGAEEGTGNAVAVRVEAAGFVERTVALPGLQAGNYADLQAVEGALFYRQLGDGGNGSTLMRYDLERRQAEVVLEGVGAYRLSADGQRALVAVGDAFHVIDAKPGQKAGEGRLDLEGLTVKVDLVAEWRQMFTDAWRIVRDVFYDPELHGVDWQELGERYASLVAGIGHRDELDFVLGELIGELEAGHAYVVSGDKPRVERLEGGKLGAELELDAASGRYRIARLLRGESWHEDFRSPLAEPGVDVAEGEYILAIDGEPLQYPDNPYRLLENKAERLVELLVASEPSPAAARKVIVRTIRWEGNLRYLDWVKSRMELVERLSGGRIGYIHLPDTSIDGNRMLQKLFYSQVAKPALIIDDRYNGGGFIPDFMIAYFRRQPMSFWARRDVESLRTPNYAHGGPKAMLINAYSSSGGDALPFYFRQAGLGTLIGTRTWGGLIGISGAPPLVDGGTVLPPTFRFYDPEGRWAVENEGVAPDIEVIDLPERRLAGGDPSIEKAVEVLLAELAARPAADPPVPEPPVLGR